MYEKLLSEASKARVKVVEFPFLEMKGLYYDRFIGLRRSMEEVEKSCVLAEELGHYHTSTGDILDQTTITNRKQEKRAQQWGYERLVPLDKLIRAYEAGVQGRHELAEFLGITEEFLLAVLKHYREKHSPQVKVGDYIICFEPLTVYRTIE